MTVIEEKGPISGIGLWLGILVVFLLFISGFWWYQIRSGGPASTTAPEGEVAGEGKNVLSASFSNLNPLNQGHYEIWARFTDRAVSLGKFDLNSENKLVDLEGEPVPSAEFQGEDDLSQAEEILISIEPDGDEVASASGVFILQGELYGDRADLSFKAINLAKVSGEYFLGTPSYSENSDLLSGVWFASPAGQEFDDQGESLNLNQAPEGFVYEGWAAHQGTYLTVGRFDSPIGDDNFAGYLGRKRYPDYPGEDFLINEPEGLDFEFPIELDDGASKVVVSLEPDIDGEDPTGFGPFFLQFLTAEIPEEAEIYTLYDLDLDLSSFPKGTVEIR